MAGSTRSAWTTFPRGPLAVWLVNPREESVRGEISRALEELVEFASSGWRSNADTDAEIVSLRIPSDKRFGKNNKLGPRCGGLGGEVGEFLKGPLGIEHRECGRKPLPEGEGRCSDC